MWTSPPPRHKKRAKSPVVLSINNKKPRKFGAFCDWDPVSRERLYNIPKNLFSNAAAIRLSITPMSSIFEKEL